MGYTTPLRSLARTLSTHISSSDLSPAQQQHTCYLSPMSSAGGLTRRRGGGRAGGADDNDDSRVSSPISRNGSALDHRGPETSFTSGENGHKIVFDPRDLSETEERSKQPKLTLMEDILLLGLKDKQVGSLLLLIYRPCLGTRSMRMRQSLTPGILLHLGVSIVLE